MGLKDVLKHHLNFEHLRFVQVGSNDGVKCDPLTNYIKDYQWKGLLIEPVPQSFKELKATYRNCKRRLIFENVAIHNKKKSATMWVHRKSTCLSSLKRNNGMLKNAKDRQIDEITVRCCSLSYLLERHNMQDLEFLCIDAEGSDYNVLLSIDLALYRPDIIYYEHKHLGKSSKKARNYLSVYGYKFEIFRKTVLAMKSC